MEIQSEFINEIKTLRDQYLIPITYTITPNRYYLYLLDGAIFCFENGIFPLAIMGATSAVETSLCWKHRQERMQDQKEYTLRELFDEFQTLTPLIRRYIEDPIVPIEKLLDSDEDVMKIRDKACKPRFAGLRDKVAHGDLLPFVFHEELKPLLPSEKDLRNLYKVRGNLIRFDVAAFVQLRKSLMFCLTWERYLGSRAREPEIIEMSESHDVSQNDNESDTRDPFYYYRDW